MHQKEKTLAGQVLVTVKEETPINRLIGSTINYETIYLTSMQRVRYELKNETNKHTKLCLFVNYNKVVYVMRKGDTK